jgi:hypothetical protein
MARNIFIVNAQIVDANGAFNTLSGYPKNFDSNSYSGDVDKAKKRAEGEFSECWGAMCKRDDRQIQVVTMSDVFGNQLDKKSMGDFPAEEEAQA